MRVGNTAIELLRDGTYKVDGGVLFGHIAKLEWEKYMKPDTRNRVSLGIYSLLIQTPGANILIDTGAGGKRMDMMKADYALRGNKLKTQLKAMSISPGDIDMVLLTNLHFDHSGGCTKLDRSGTASPLFTKAQHMVQKVAWDAAAAPNERFAGAFYEDDYEPLDEYGLVTLLDGEKEVVPGVTVKPMQGPCAGNQVVFIEHGSERIIYAGDLIPTQFHLPLHHIPATAEFPNEAMEQKRELIEMSLSDGWKIVFGNGMEDMAGYISGRRGKMHFESVPI